MKGLIIVYKKKGKKCKGTILDKMQIAFATVDDRDYTNTTAYLVERKDGRIQTVYPGEIRRVVR